MVPEGWRASQIGDVSKFSSGGTPSKKREDFWGGSFPWISGKDLKTHYLSSSIDKLTELGFKNAKKAPTGASLVLVRGMTLLKDFPVGYVTRSVSFNQDIKALVPDKSTDGLFLSFLLAGNKNCIRQLVSTAGHGTGRLDSESLKSYPINVPPLPEQKKIAKILSTWDEAIVTTEQLLANSQQQKKALMQQLLTGKKRFPGFEGEWETDRFDKLLDLQIGGTPSRSNPSYWDDSKSSQNRWISIADLKGPEVHDTKEYISDLGAKNSNVKMVKAGTVVMSFKLTIGRRAILRTDAYTNEAICALVPKQDEVLTNRFLFHAIEIVNFDQEIDQAVKGRTLNKAKLNRLRLSYPCVKEQAEISNCLDTADAEIATLQQKLDRLKEEKKALMQQLLTGKRRVKIDKEDAA